MLAGISGKLKIVVRIIYGKNSGDLVGFKIGMIA
jgi:hypothetical protein